jgi:hypothetical protein
VRLDFGLRGIPGYVEVSLEANTAPAALGCGPEAEDFPVCTARVAYAAGGYNAALGWIQLVRSTDGAGGGDRFELDPFEPLGRSPNPFCWFGFAPTLFDAPSRTVREPMEWTAHSFLCFIASGTRGPEARAILGFSWGFVIKDDTVLLEGPASIAPAEWDRHVPLLRSEHPVWDFAAGYRDR